MRLGVTNDSAIASCTGKPSPRLSRLHGKGTLKMFTISEVEDHTPGLPWELSREEPRAKGSGCTCGAQDLALEF